MRRLLGRSRMPHRNAAATGNRRRPEGPSPSAGRDRGTPVMSARAIALATLAAIAALHIGGAAAIGMHRTSACAERGIEFCAEESRR